MPLTPYLTDAELLAAPTGIAWETVPRGSATDEEQKAERARLILDASSWINTEAGQKLEATHDSEVLPFPGRRASIHNGALFIQTKFSPLISVEAVEYSTDGATWQPVGGTVVIAARSAFYVVPGVNGTGLGYGRFIRPTYTDGYPNATVPTGIDSGATVILPDSAVGMRPGGSLTIYDGDLTEDVTIDVSYVPESLTVPITAPVLNAHDAGVVVSAIPSEVRYAARLVIQHQVRLRSRDAVAALGGEGGPPKLDTADIDEARQRLKAYRRLI